MEDYKFYEFTIPGYMLEGLKAYIKTGRPMGGFLTAVVNNDLRGAVDAADNHNRINLVAYIGYLYNKAPSGCWGSPKLVKAWRKAGGMDGITATETAKEAAGVPD